MGRGNDQRSGKLMAGDDKKSAQKAPPKEKASAKEITAVEPKGKTPAEAPVEAKTEAKAEASKNYSRGEGQKPVSQAYKDNWNAIYGQKKQKKKKR
jgi:hypothetical protein